MAQTDREALVALYSATDGPNWKHKTNWGSGAPLSDWYGVTANDQGRVVELQLYDNNLQGSIPPELGNLAALKELYLSRNQLSGHIPQELGTLSTLQTLIVGDNELTGHIPKELGTLSMLRELSLRHNQLAGRIPPELGTLSELRKLSLYENKLTGPIPKELGALSELQELWLFKNHLTGSVPAPLVKLRFLRSLDLSNNLVSGPVPSLQQLADVREALFPSGYIFQESMPEAMETGSNADVGRLKSEMTAKSGKGSPTTSGRTSPMSWISSTTSGITSTTSWKDPTSVFKEDEPSISSVKQHQLRRVPGTTTTGDDPGVVFSARMAAMSGIEGGVVAWSFGDRAETLGGAEFELKVLRPLGRNIPCLIGLSSSSCQKVDGKQCLLHPVVTCLAGTGETFSPLLLRFSVGHVDSMESGSECGSDDDPEMNYRDYLKSTFSVVTREDGSSEWVPKDGAIEQAEEGVFVLEVIVSHFCDFALKQVVKKVDPGFISMVSLPTQRRQSRESHYHFVNQGEQPLVIYCWGAAKQKIFTSSLGTEGAASLTGVRFAASGDRTVRDIPESNVYSVDVPGGSADGPWGTVCRRFPFESMEVVWATQGPPDPDQRLVKVWGVLHMEHKQALVFGALLDRDPEFEIEASPREGVYVGNRVRVIVERREIA